MRCVLRPKVLIFDSFEAYWTVRSQSYPPSNLAWKKRGSSSEFAGSPLIRKGLAS
jgi:hypothetical protein